MDGGSTGLNLEKPPGMSSAELSLRRRLPRWTSVLTWQAAMSCRRSRHGERPYRNGLDPSLVPIIVAGAHWDGLRVAAHVETAADFRAAPASGIDEIAHMPGWYLERAEEGPSFRLTEEDARAAARAGVVVTTTTVAMQPFQSHHEPSPHHKSGGHEQPGHSMAMEDSVWREAEHIQADNLRLLHQHGVVDSPSSVMQETKQ